MKNFPREESKNKEMSVLASKDISSSESILKMIALELRTALLKRTSHLTRTYFNSYDITANIKIRIVNY